MNEAYLDQLVRSTTVVNCSNGGFKGYHIQSLLKSEPLQDAVNIVAESGKYVKNLGKKGFSKRTRSLLGGRYSFRHRLWAVDDVCPGFKNHIVSPGLQASSPLCNGLLRFTSEYNTC